MAWDTHINNVTNKANGVLGFLKRNLKISSSSIKEKAFVRPLLEYSATVWDPHTRKNIVKLEADCTETGSEAGFGSSSKTYPDETERGEGRE
ncbi:Hypp5901 [Branchiostoma lanceolatum]|uniref:Hypp5901 protein n=1 Tax=Branchiostoma lanceolatum TaxID=7740 RepID=A0A8J9VGJ9_BRALA|nr:Hypp5901 [Branchiostoma lanceolatum]